MYVSFLPSLTYSFSSQLAPPLPSVPWQPRRQNPQAAWQHVSVVGDGVRGTRRYWLATIQINCICSLKPFDLGLELKFDKIPDAIQCGVLLLLSDAVIMSYGVWHFTFLNLLAKRNNFPGLRCFHKMQNQMLHNSQSMYKGENHSGIDLTIPHTR